LPKARGWNPGFKAYSTGTDPNNTYEYLNRKLCLPAVYKEHIYANMVKIYLRTPRTPGVQVNDYKEAVLRIRIRDPVPFCPLDLGWVKKIRTRPEMNNPDHISVSLETIF
jgi:hypothetical protein